ncbi:MAG: hypothetical protein ACTSWN_04130, partial [Promethearchaeota archaeon]
MIDFNLSGAVFELLPSLLQVAGNSLFHSFRLMIGIKTRKYIFSRGLRARNKQQLLVLASFTLILAVGIETSFSIVPFFKNLKVQEKTTSNVDAGNGGGAGTRNGAAFLQDGLPSPSYFPGEQLWNRTWGGSNYDYGSSIWGDGTYLYTCGATYSYGPGDYDLLLVKWDADGNQVWNRTWGGFDYDEGYSVWGNGTYLYTCGTTYSYGAGYDDLLLVKWDADGNQVWNRTWGGPNYDGGRSVWGDGNYVYTCGKTQSFGAGGYELLLVKWDADGNQVWNRTWGGSDWDEGNSVWGDGSYIYTCGYTQSYGAGGYELLLVKWDADGNQVWNQTWGGSSDDCGRSVWGDGTYLYTCGSTSSYGAGSDDLLFVKWNADGNQVWNRTWGGSAGDVGYSVLGDGSYIYTCGYSWSFGAGSLDLFLVKWDTNGNLVWNRTWGGSDFDFGYSVWADGSYLYTCGYTNSYGAGLSDLLLIKWDSTMIDFMENDDDGDGLSYCEEIYIYKTNATNNDTDADGLTDGEEILTYNTNATSNDTDSDGLIDGDEVFIYSTNVTNNDTDSDGLTDGGEIITYSTNATSNDTDSEGLSDRDEILTYNTNSTSNETDSDCLSD